MSKSLNFGIEFHGPFRVATGLASRGADVAVNREDPLPATSLKGLMRDAAHTRLGLPAATVDAVFGSTAEPSPWSWTRGVVASTLATRTRVRIDRDSGTVDQGAKLYLFFFRRLFLAHNHQGCNRQGNGNDNYRKKNLFRGRFITHHI